MRKSLVFVIMSSLIAMSGCATEAPSPTDDTHGFTRGDDGKALDTNVSELDQPTQAFDHELPHASLTAESDAAAATCSGACNASVCVCSGDYDCCVVGCGICFVLAN